MGKVISLADRKVSKTEKTTRTASEEFDFDAVMKANQEKKNRVNKDRAKKNSSITRGLKK